MEPTKIKTMPIENWMYHWGHKLGTTLAMANIPFAYRFTLGVFDGAVRYINGYKKPF